MIFKRATIYVYYSRVKSTFFSSKAPKFSTYLIDPTMSSFGNRFKFSPTRYEELDGETSLMTSEEQVLRLFFF